MKMKLEKEREEKYQKRLDFLKEKIEKEEKWRGLRSRYWDLKQNLRRQNNL